MNGRISRMVLPLLGLLTGMAVISGCGSDTKNDAKATTQAIASQVSANQPAAATAVASAAAAAASAVANRASPIASAAAAVASQVAAQASPVAGQVSAAARSAWASLSTDGSRLIDQLQTGGSADNKAQLLSKCRDAEEKVKKENDSRAGDVTKLCDQIRDTDVNAKDSWGQVKTKFNDLNKQYGTGG